MRIIVFILLIISSLSALSQKQKIELASPVYLGAILIDKLDPTDMAETCKYYNYKESTPEEDYSVYIGSDGSKIRYKFTDTTPIVEVIIDEKRSTVKKQLLKGGFQKVNDKKKDIFQFHNTRCEISNQSQILRFSKIPPKKY